MIRGIFTAHSNIVGDRVGDFASRVLQYMPQGSAPLLALSSGMPKRPAQDTAFSWIEDDHISGATTATETVASGILDFDVADPNLWTPNTIILNTVTQERMLVTAIAGVNVTVVRGIAGTTAAAVTTGDKLHNIGTAFGEGSGKPTAMAQRGDSRTNYVQIFKNGWSITGTAQAIAWHTGNQLATNRAQCSAYHAEDIEKAFIWGRKGYMQVNNQTVFLSDGILAQIAGYGGLVEASIGGTPPVLTQISMASFMDFMRRIFDVNVKGAANERLAFTSSQTLMHINNAARMDSTVNMESMNTNETWGMKFTRVHGLNGDLKIMTHPLFSELGYHNIMVIHPGFIHKRELRGTVSEEFDAQKSNNAGVDATEGFLLSHLGFEIAAVKTMGLLTGITTPVPSF